MKSESRVALTIGSFNVASGLNTDFEAINRLLVKNKIDIVGLQEVDRFTVRNPTEMLAEIAKKDFPYISYGKTMDWHDGGDYGIGIASKFPHTRVYNEKYNVTGEEDRVFQKVSFEVTSGIEVVFFNTHLAFESKEIRKYQVEQLLEAVKKEKNPYYIITGDFNFDQGTEEWSAFKEFNLSNGKNDQWFDTFLYYEEGMKSRAIDNIIVSKNIEIKDVYLSSTPLSDHGLLVAQIEFTV